ncbi:sensor histidine kinase [Dysgonomonas sp. 520]|uniref:sensor histidine kinase n=1 Tax=Dysgonomonas sp. 520 TaxID=2302931 RepID=UPI0013D0C476|nr:ATP-binding protein [Dysgonomonas sp. 520]NDW08656.1 hypothetical protein [Dysgonomonas sp. 520]
MFRSKTIFLSVILITCINYCANANQQEVKTEPVLDSLINIINNKSIPFKDKYQLDSVVRNTPALRKYRNIVCIQLIPKAKKEKAYSEIVRLYTNAASYNIGQNEIPTARSYLDSAKFILDKNINFRDLGFYYRNEGDYYGMLRQYDSTHSYYYKSIEAYEKANSNYNDIISILRNMSIVHFNKQNYDEVKKIIDKMKSIAPKCEDPVYVRMKIDEVAGGYYKDMNLYESDNNTHLDSAYMYYNDAVILYESLDSIQAKKYRSSIFYPYTKLAEIEIAKPKTDWNIVDKSISQVKEITQPEDSLKQSIILVLEAAVFIHKCQYDNAENKIKAAQKIIDIVSKRIPEYKNEYFDIYRAYTDLYKAKGDYINALKYIELSHDIRIQYMKETNNEIIKELDAKYETAQKDVQISTLQVEKEKERRNKIFILGFCFFILVMLVISLLYSRIQRLKKDKEASILLTRIKEKDAEFIIAANKAELRSMRSYLNGLETERERLAKELHDNVANELLSIDFLLKSTTDTSEKISSQIENLHNEIRNISHELMPPLFKYASLPQIISDYIAKISEGKDIQVKLNIKNEQGFDDIPNDNLLEVYRIVQETTSNIIKHSEATTAEIKLECCNSTIIMKIEDNGKGFNPTIKQNGIGLLITKDRIHSMDGTIEIDSSDGNGCRIYIQLPISQQGDSKWLP